MLRRAGKTMAQLRWPRSPLGVSQHLVRLTTVAARTGFWLLAYYYYGAEALLHMAAAWTFISGVRDLTFVRLRLRSLHRRERRRRAMAVSLGTELMLLILRLAIIAGLAATVDRFNASVGSILIGLAPFALLWARETMTNVAHVYRTIALRLHLSLFSALGGLAGIFYGAETGMTAIQAALAGLLAREAIFFAGMWAIALAGKLGLRVEGENHDDEEGGAPESVIGPEGREIRSTWKILIADNAVWSRWRLIQFGVRHLATGLFGPFGAAAARILFTYHQPGSYVHKSARLNGWRVALACVAGAAVVAVAIVLAGEWGLIDALGVTVAAFAFRLAVIVANSLAWRQLAPLVGLEGNLLLPGSPMRKRAAPTVPRAHTEAGKSSATAP